MRALEVIDDPAVASMALSPMRNRLLAELREPASAAMLAERVGLARQKVTYHLNALEAGGLIREVERRRWGGITERLFEATAASYVVSPDALGEMGGDPDRVPDRLSARYLIALAARMVREVGALLRRAEREDKRLATLGIDTVIAFRSPAERAAFTDELTRGVAALAARYHDEDGRPHRLVVAAHPVPSS